MSKTLAIDITLNQVDPNQLNATYQKNAASTAADALVDVAGNINLEKVEDLVVITWNLVDVSNVKFMSIPPGAPSNNNGPFRWTPKNPGNPGQENGLGWTVDSETSDSRSLTVTDTNAASQEPTPFTYSLWLTGGNKLDPSIINR